MPQADKHVERVPLDDNAYMFSRGEKWTLRVNLPNARQFVRSLKIDVKGGDNAKNEALEKAQALYDEVVSRLELDLPPNMLTIPKLCELYRKEAEEGTAINEEAGRKIARIPGGRGGWSKTQLALVNGAIDTIILPFFSKPAYRGKAITKITQMDIDKWQGWRLKEFPDYAPSSHAKQNQIMRHIFKLAQRMGERFIPPMIQDQPKEIRKRRRLEVNDDHYDQILGYLRDKYARDKWGIREKYAFLHYQYIETLNHTGIRPFQSPQNAIKMSHIRIGEDSDGNRTMLLERFEKDKAYTAVASPYWKFVIERLHAFYNSIGIPDEREYLFVHPIDVPGNNIVKGEPIGSFRNGWQRMIKDLGFNDGKKEQSERITPYGIRHRYAGRRLVQNKVPISELAEIMGTSITMISEIYSHFSANANYARMVANDYETEKWIEIFQSGGASPLQLERNSELHHKLYEAHPDWFQIAPDSTIKLSNKATLERWKDGRGGILAYMTEEEA